MIVPASDYQKAQEIDDVFVLLEGLVIDLKAKKSLAEIGADNLPKLLAAVDKVNEIPEEVKSNRKVCIATAGYRAGEIVDTLLGPA